MVELKEGMDVSKLRFRDEVKNDRREILAATLSRLTMLNKLIKYVSLIALCFIAYLSASFDNFSDRFTCLICFIILSSVYYHYYYERAKV